MTPRRLYIIVALALSACEFPDRAEELACDSSEDCGPGRVCDVAAGWCVLDGDPESYPDGSPGSPDGGADAGGTILPGDPDAGEILPGMRSSAPGLLAEYLFDDPAFMTNPHLALDSTANPLHLPIAVAGASPQHGEGTGGWALNWNATGTSSGACASPIAGTELVTGLQGAQKFSIEMVVTLRGGQVEFSRLFDISSGLDDWDMTLGYASSPATLWLRWKENRTLAKLSSPTLMASLLNTRATIAFVVDTTDSDSEDRVRVYVNGQPVSMDGDVSPPFEDSRVELSSSTGFCLGNRVSSGLRSPDATLHYLAFYNLELSSTQIQTHHTALNQNHDALPGVP